MASSSEARASFEELALLLERRIADEQEKVLRVYAKAYSEIIAEIRKIYDRYADKDSGIITNADRTTMMRLTAIGRRCAERLGIAHGKVQQMLEADCREVYGDSFFQMAYRVDGMMSPMRVDWGLIPESAVDLAIADDYAMLARSKTFQSALNRRSTDIQELFGKAIIKGHSYERVRDALIARLGVSRVAGGAARHVGSGVSAWAMMVARTEIHRAYSLAQKKLERIVEEQGLDIDFVWLATLDGRTRPAHGALDGQRKDREHDGWNVPGIGWVRGPGLSGVASFDINCRCTVIPIPRGGENPALRHVDGYDGPTGWMTYEEWKASIPKSMRLKVDLDLSLVGQGDREDFRTSVVSALSKRGALESVDRLNRAFLEDGRVRFRADGRLAGESRAYCSGSLINIPTHILKTSYGKETIAHEARHFMENMAARTDEVRGRHADFVSAMRRTLDLLSPRDSRWDKLCDVVAAYPRQSCVGDLVSMVSDKRIPTGFSHKAYEVSTDDSKAGEMLADLHSIATTDPQIYGLLQSILDDLTDAFERYTLSLLGDV